MSRAAAPASATIVAPDEERRLAAARRYAILDTPPDGAFDRITLLAARLLRAPISTISIVDRHRIWFKAKVGLDVDEVGRDPGLCASAILQGDPWLVTDAARDPRALANPLVRGSLGLRFYLGIPLTTRDGYRLGTLNVIDREPREVASDEIETLSDLAAVVVDELELRLSALREERRLDQMRLDFLATAAHELRTLRVAISRASAALGTSAVGTDAPDHPLLEVEERAGRLEEVVERVSAELGTAADRIQIVRRSFDPAWAARRAVEEARRRLPANVTLELSTEGGPSALEADPDAVSRILAYLVDNAIRFSPDGGRVELRVVSSGRGTRFVVRDEGIGVPESERERIFEKFHRAQSAVARGLAGTGLGLHVAAELARELGGRITLEAAPGAGSIFALELPAD